MFDIFGLGTGLELCARMQVWLLPGTGYLTKVNSTTSATWQVAFPGNLPTLISVEDRTPEERFPYGIPVYAD